MGNGVDVDVMEFADRPIRLDTQGTGCTNAQGEREGEGGKEGREEDQIERRGEALGA